MGQSKPIAKSILIVEDEALIRFNLIDFFEDAGYRVSEAETADEAIAILDQNSSIRVVLTDVQMPGSMDGLKLAHYIRDRFPPTVLVVTSGVLNPTKRICLRAASSCQSLLTQDVFLVRSNVEPAKVEPALLP